MYKKVTEDDIVAFQTNYRGGEEEATDLRALYERFSGDMAMCAAAPSCTDSFAANQTKRGLGGR